jgi:hypothetical protein
LLGQHSVENLVVEMAKVILNILHIVVNTARKLTAAIFM